MTDLPYGAWLHTVNAQETYRYRRGISLCSSCHRELTETVCRIQVPAKEIDGIWCGGIAAECCSEEHALDCLQEQYDPKQYVILCDGNPTEEKNSPWLHAFREVGDYPRATERCGKWLVYRSVEHIDRFWQFIKAAVEQGKLGDHAKVVTAASATPGMPYVICVHTYDYEDAADVRQIRQTLREMGIKRPIKYKADEDTYQMRYGNAYIPCYYE
jgi:hypothetical protein